MKLTLTRGDLSRALAGSGKVVERRSTIPILMNVKIEASAGRLKLTATDGDLELQTAIPAHVEQPGETTVAAALLGDYVRRLPDKAELSLALAADEKTILVKSGRSRVTLGVMPAVDFPTFSHGGMPHAFRLPGRDLARIFGHAEHSISTEETRYYLNGIYLHVAEGGTHLRCVSTDGHRLSRVDYPCPAGAEAMPGVIVPRKTVAEFRRLAAEADEADIAIALSDRKISLETGETRLVSKLIDGTFPDYARIIPSASSKTATLDAGDLAGAIERVNTVASERGQSMAAEFGEGGRLVLSMGNKQGLGSAEEELSGEHAGGAIRIGFNPRYAGEILSALGSDTVEIALEDPGSVMLWRSPADSSRLYLLMPMRV